MCSSADQHPPESGPRIAWANLMQPGPLGWKLQRLFANTWKKFRTGERCCGNDGEPGC
jgi:hypothetical protein